MQVYDIIAKFTCQGFYGLFYKFIGHAAAGHEIDIPDKACNRDKQHEDKVAASADIVHAADNQRDWRQQFDNAEKRKEHEHYHAESVYLRVKARKADNQQCKQYEHYYRIAQHSPPEFAARGRAAVIESPCPEFFKSVIKFHTNSMGKSQKKRAPRARFLIIHTI